MLHAKLASAGLQEQLESNLTKARAENAQLASRVHQLETQCSSLEGTAKDAEQQQRHDHCYQDELLADRQQANQVCRIASHRECSPAGLHDLHGMIALVPKASASCLVSDIGCCLHHGIASSLPQYLQVAKASSGCFLS